MNLNCTWKGNIWASKLKARVSIKYLTMAVVEVKLYSAIFQLCQGRPTFWAYKVLKMKNRSDGSATHEDKQFAMFITSMFFRQYYPISNVRNTDSSQ